jgi:NADH-quinone oxidoreductase subunit L
MEIMLMLIATALVLVLGSLSYLKFKKQTLAELNEPRQGFSLWGEHKFYVDELYHNVFVKPLESLGDFFFYYIEHYFIQPITFGSSRIVYSAGQLLRIVQNGNIEYYLIYIAIGAVIVLFLSMFVF